MANKGSVWQNPKLNVDPKEAGFTLYTITTSLIDPVTGGYGTVNIQGFTLGDTGLGYYQNPDDPTQYVPVHLATGAALSDGGMSLGGCQGYVRELAGLLDWHDVGEDGPPGKALAGLLAIKAKYL